MEHEKTEAHRGYVSELFCSVQGEGPYVGSRQVFLRMAGCSGTCGYCDTAYSRDKTDTCTVYSREERHISNPIGLDTVVSEIERLASADAGVRAVCITGGEPLEQGPFVADIAEALKRAGFRITLETNGTDPLSAGKIVPFLDIIAMDMKLPSATGVDHWDAHRDCLNVFRAKEVFIKVVIDGNSTMNELVKVIEMIAAVDRGIPLILQPESGELLAEARGKEGSSLIPALLRFQAVALRSIEDVRIIPQCHRILGLR